jgi:hypothetical protein
MMMSPNQKLNPRSVKQIRREISDITKHENRIGKKVNQKYGSK